jgi:MFS transporter, DHA1 family, tetracycline resistance protein
MQQSNRKPAIIFIFITILIDVVGFGLIIPVVPGLISNLKNIPVNEASTYGGILLAVYAGVQFLCAPIMGGLSDKYGRRPILLLALLGFALDYFLTAWAPTYNWLFAGRVIAGIFGSSITTATSYIADISTNENRAQNFGMVGAAFGIGFIVGPSLGGLLNEHFGASITFIVAGIFTLINFLYGLFVLPESLTKENRRSFSFARANPLGNLKQLQKNPKVLYLAMSMFILFLAVQSVQTTWAYFTEFTFKWSEAKVGWSLGIVGLIVGIVQGVVVRYTIPKLGNAKSIYIGLLFYALGCFLFSIASAGWLMFVFLIPYCLGGIGDPALRSEIASLVPANEQGELQGALTSLQSLASIFGPLLMTGLFSYFSKPNPIVQFSGAAFLMGALLMLCALGLVRYTLQRK